MKKTFIIPVSWQMSGTYRIEADSLEDAINEADHLPLPNQEDSEFIDGSFEVNKDMIEFYNPKD